MNQADRDELLIRIDERVGTLSDFSVAHGKDISELKRWRNITAGAVGAILTILGIK